MAGLRRERLLERQLTRRAAFPLVAGAGRPSSLDEPASRVTSEAFERTSGCVASRFRVRNRLLARGGIEASVSVLLN